jgi:hypothetical protein
MRFPLLLVGLGMLVASPTWAADLLWYKNCQESQPTQAIAPGEFACFDFEVGTTVDRWQTAAVGDYSEVLQVHSCQSVNIFFDPDIESNAVGSFVAEVNIYNAVCTDSPTTADPENAGTCQGRLLADIDGGGVDEVTLNGDDGTDPDPDGNPEQRQKIREAAAFGVIVAIDTMGTAGDHSRVIVTCPRN